jgi:hypothetical protein
MVPAENNTAVITDVHATAIRPTPTFKIKHHFHLPKQSDGIKVVEQNTLPYLHKKKQQKE